MRRSSLLVLLVALAACADAPPPALTPDAAAERDSVLALLRTLDTAAIDSAYARLQAPYVFETTTQQLRSDGEFVATQTRTIRVTERGLSEVERDSSGAFDFGGFAGFADRRRALPDVASSPATLVLDEDPPYLDPRGAEVFAFALAGDTLVGERALRILSVTVRPGEDTQPLRDARLYVDEAGALVGARVMRRQASMLFEEASTATLFLRPGPGGWLPERLTVDAIIQAPLTDARRFRLSERYTFPE